MVIHLAWMALVSSNRPTCLASATSRRAKIAWLWKCRSVCNQNLPHNKSLPKKDLTKSIYIKYHLEVLGNFMNKPLERKLSIQKLGTLLILTDFTT
jgi:hypothetical protein